MNGKAFSFLTGVLGEDGAQAFRKAVRHRPRMEPVLIPRAILSWLDVAARCQYEGELPGLENTYFTVSKSEQGFDGAVTIGDEVFSFEHASLFHVAASVAVNLGLAPESMETEIKDIELSRLGKNIDLLVKAKAVATQIGEGLEKRILDPNAGYRFEHQHIGEGNEAVTKIHAFAPEGEHVGTAVFAHGPDSLTPGLVSVDEAHQRRGLASHMYSQAEKLTGKKIVASKNQTDEGAALWAGNKAAPQFGMGKAELPGETAKPKEQQGPEEPVAPQLQSRLKKPATPKAGAVPKLPVPKTSVPKLPSLKVTKAEAEVRCQICGQRQFSQAKFTGCLCFSSLAKSVKTVPRPDGYLLDFDDSWDRDALEALMQTIHRGP